MGVIRTVMLALAFLLTLSACSDSEPRSEQVEPVAVPDEACDLVPADVIADWDLTVSEQSTSNRELLGFGRCVMAGPESSEVALDLSLTTYGGGDAGSADKFAADERSESCAELSATESAKGVIGEDDVSCTATSSAEGTTTTTSISEVADVHGVVRVVLSAEDGEADRVESTVADLVDAVATTAR